MRRLVNAYGAWLDKMDNGDTFDELLGMASFVGLIVAASVLLLAAIVVPIAIIGSREPAHGSCRIGHFQWTGKTNAFVCDEYYPLPVER